MRLGYFYILFFTCLFATAQDKVYLLSGARIDGNVVEVSNERVLIDISGSKSSFGKESILLIQYKNGLVEMYNTPRQNSVFEPVEKASKGPSFDRHELPLQNYTSVNTLALCNSDISVFYERTVAGNKIGLGVMGAYNFNLRAQIPNLFIATLNNAKKNYDVGCFINFHPRGLVKRANLYYGLLIKYTDFSYSSVREETSASGGTYLVFTPSKGSQLAFIPNIGLHIAVAKNFFVKTFFGLGGFSLTGDYRKDFNKIMNDEGAKQDSTYIPVDYSVLPKIYIGINAGFKF